MKRILSITFFLAIVATGLFSHFIFRKPDNVLLKMSDAMDERLAKFPVLSPYFRYCLIVIEK